MGTLAEVKKQAGEVKISSVFDFMEQKKDLIAKALPQAFTADRLIGLLTLVLKGSPKLMECTQASLIGAVIQTIQVGLQVGNVGHVYYVPFKNKQADGSYKMEVQFQIGYKGMIELVNRSGKACILNTECVYEKDQFQYEQGLNPVLRHVPAQGNRGAFVGVYCIAKHLVANEKMFIFLNKEEVDKVRNASKAKSELSPWNTWFDEMAKKTAVKRICKSLPLSVDVQKQISADETIKPAIDKSMVDLPDKANWDATDAEVVQTAPASEPAPIDDQPDQVAPAVVSDQKHLSDVEVGQTIAEVELLVHGVEFKEKVGKNGKSVFHAEDTQGQEYYIDKWGSCKDAVEGQICTFLAVKVGDYQGKRQYMADKVILKG